MAEKRDDLVAGYTRALVALGEAEGALEELADELYAFARRAEQSPDLTEQLASPALPAAARVAVLDDLLAGQAHDVTVAALALLVRAGHARQLVAIAESLSHAAAAASRHVLAEVRSAYELDADQRARLAAALGAATGKDVEVKVTVDPTLVGGLVATVGDTVIDGSLARRLSDLQQRFAT